MGTSLSKLHLESGNNRLYYSTWHFLSSYFALINIRSQKAVNFNDYIYQVSL